MYSTGPAIAIDDAEIDESFVRASGPGRQNVNKLSTAVQLRFDARRSASLPDAVAVGDGALRLGATPLELTRVLADVGPRRGIATARRALELLDGRSESYGESISRVLLLERGFLDLVPQQLVRDGRGVVVARVDFAWPALGVIGEFDGRVKYGRKLAPDQDPEKALWREKMREDLLRDLGWQVVRWMWTDLEDPRAWFARLERAFARGHAITV